MRAHGRTRSFSAARFRDGHASGEGRSDTFLAEHGRTGPRASSSSYETRTINIPSDLQQRLMAGATSLVAWHRRVFAICQKCNVPIRMRSATGLGPCIDFCTGVRDLRTFACVGATSVECQAMVLEGPHPVNSHKDVIALWQHSPLFMCCGRCSAHITYSTLLRARLCSHDCVPIRTTAHSMVLRSHS